METSSSNSTKVERRKLRRGTTSCWECKRRKTRCHFEQENQSTCVSCKRRGCKCVLQHIDERHLEPETGVRNRDIREQVDHLETLVDRLVHPPAVSRDSDAPPRDQASSLETGAEPAVSGASRRHDTNQQARQPQASHPKRRILLPKLDKTLAKTSNFSLDNGFRISNDKPQPSASQRPSKYLQIHPSLLTTDPTSGSLRCNSLTLLLQSILPSVSVTTRIMHQNMLLMMSMHVFRGLSTDPFRPPPHPRQIAQFASPSPKDARPIDLARSLFQLAICLQQSDRVSELSELCLGRSNNDIAGQYFMAASRYVTSQDSLVASPEGIETLMFEALYHVSTGQLRLAWLVFRRALGIAHLIGLHIPQRRRQGRQSRAGNSLAPICPATLWFRLIFMERHLSMVLCLPMSVTDDSFMDDLVGQGPQERLERVQAKLTGRIIARNEMMRHGKWGDGFIYDHYKETKDIDYMLKQAARSLSADWWANPRPRVARTNVELQDMTTKIVHQLHHYNLVLLLHILYVVPGIEDGLAHENMQVYANSKLSAMIASRELLTRSVIPVGPNRPSSSTRGIILKIVLSVLALLLGHLDSHRLGRENALDHQRPRDLSLVERGIENLEAVAEKYDDTLCRSASLTLRRLRVIEATAAGGVHYKVWNEPSEMMHLECIVQEENNSVKMLFPYMGTIHILRQDREEAVSVSGAGSQIAAAGLGGLDDTLLTPSWAWGNSPLSSWPDLASNSSTIDDTQGMFAASAFADHSTQAKWDLQGGDVGYVETLPASRLFLQDYEFQGWDVND
ncbi:c6 zinc finger domain [Trichoderma arundinaceum]|uniref:C6 zinc finger domain n=1 Tax=Trichoderma arundinaceum TaxID=490622 RepID=A0A395NYL6_TRIAR|nr:c6 zinc finger domain [Trichoderma arundinaceum]